MKRQLLDFLAFRRMISPVLLQILFWPAALASIYFSAWLIFEGNAIGWVPLIVGTLFVRVIFEVLLLLFRILDRLAAIEARLNTDGT